MSLFASLSSDGLEETSDRLGGFSPKETNIYTGIIKAMYAGKSAGGAMSVSIVFDTNGTEYKETAYITNKDGQNFFLNKQDNSKKVPLPGFTMIDDICLIVTGKSLAEQTTEAKVINLYDKDAGKEQPTGVEMLVECIGQEVSLGIVKQLVNKGVKNTTTGKYDATAEVREENYTDKVFHTESKMTVVEARTGAEKATFWDSWLERNKDVTKDKRTVKDGQAGAVAGGPPKATAAGAVARPSLFGNKK